MKRRYPGIAFTSSVRRVQEEQGSRDMGARLEAMERPDVALGPREREHIEGLDHFYVASVGEDGWPYVQYRGGPRGFLRVLDDRSLGFADFSGNRQYITTGNVRHDDRVSLLLLDQARRTRLKVFARAEVRGADDDVTRQVTDPDYAAEVERGVLLHVEAFDWNCPQHITPRYTAEELAELVGGWPGPLPSDGAVDAPLCDELRRERVARSTAG